MKAKDTSIPDVKIITPKVFGDDRGFFFESCNKKDFEAAIGKQINFVQDNHARSEKGVLRGLHYQINNAQGKLVRVILGEIYDVAVDIRKNSDTFGMWAGFSLTAENKLQLWVPEGFAHGYFVLSEYAEVIYKTTDYYAPEYERCIIYNDEKLNIDWHIPKNQAPFLSDKDLQGVTFEDAEIFE